jgi:hypothetical protein
MAPNQYVQERLCELREEAYCKVLKCFVAGQQYDLVQLLAPPPVAVRFSMTRLMLQQGGLLSGCTDANQCKLLACSTGPGNALQGKLRRGRLLLPWRVQKKELMLSQLRAELCISDERHDELRQSVSAGEERPWIRRALSKRCIQALLNTHHLVIPALD